MTEESKNKIFELANKSNIISVNNGNMKTGLACLTLSFPTCSCLENAPCKKGCYCLKGRQVFPNVLGAYYRNWRLWHEDPSRFEEQLNALITVNGLPLFRYNDAGDLPDAAYFQMIVRVAEKHPDVKFLVYTKKYDIPNGFLDNGGVIPENLCVRFSYWDKNWEVPNPYHFPVAYVEFKDASLTPAIPSPNYQCLGTGATTCSACKVCFNKKVETVVFHQH